MFFKKTGNQGKKLAAPNGARERIAPAPPNHKKSGGTDKKKNKKKQGSLASCGTLLATAAAVILVLRRKEKKNAMLFKRTGNHAYQPRRLATPDGEKKLTEKAPDQTEEIIEAVPNQAEKVIETAPEKTEKITGAAPDSTEVLTGETGAIAQSPEASAPAEERRLKKNEKKQGFWANYGYLLVTAAVVLLVFRVLLQLAFVPSGSMERTIPTDSLLISWQLPYLVSDPQPQRGDVVTFWNDELDKLLVKRVIGLPGEEITFSGGYVYVDGERLEEDYLPSQGITQCDKSFQVPEGRLFMLGDNRTSSTDSRFWKYPYVRLSDVRARVMVCIPISYHPIGLFPKWRGLPLPIVGDIHLIG